MQIILSELPIKSVASLGQLNKELQSTARSFIDTYVRKIPLSHSVHELNRVTLFNTDYDDILAQIKRECRSKKEELLQAYNGQASFYSRETGAESLEAYGPCVLMTVPTMQFIRMHIENSIVCNIAVTTACRGVKFVVDNVTIFNYTQDILHLYPIDPMDGFINLGLVFQFFPIKASAIYLLFEFPWEYSQETCLQHMRFDLLHPPFPFIHHYHTIDIPLEIIRPAFICTPNTFTTDFSHFQGILFHTQGKTRPVLYLVDDVEIDPNKLIPFHPLSHDTRVLWFDHCRALPIQINIFPKTAHTRIYFITTNILSLMMFWRLQCS